MSFIETAFNLGYVDWLAGIHNNPYLYLSQHTSWLSYEMGQEEAAEDAEYDLDDEYILARYEQERH